MKANQSNPANQQNSRPKRRGFLTLSGVALATGAYAWLRRRFDFSEWEAGLGRSMDEIKASAESAWNEARIEQTRRLEARRLEAERRAKILERIRAGFNLAQKEAETSNQQALREFEGGIPASIQGPFSRARAASREVAIDLHGFRNCAWLALKIAYDQFMKTTKTAEFLGLKLQPVTGAVLKAHQASETAKSKLAEKLAVGRNRFQAMLGEVLEQEQVESGAPELWHRHYLELVERPGSLAARGAVEVTVSTGLGVAFSALDFYLLREPVKKLTAYVVRAAKKALAKAIAKLAKTAAISTASAVSDGPLPVGDVIGLVLAVGVCDAKGTSEASD